MTALNPAWALGSVIAAASVMACQGCHTASGGPGPVSPAVPGAPTVRLYLVSDLAGALEPCGCTKDQLGGLDHAAAWMTSERARAPFGALVLAGPTFFMNAALTPDHKDQDLLKAETLGSGLKAMGCAALAPGQNDWAGGAPELAKLRLDSGAAVLTADLPGGDTAGSSRLVVLNGVPLGFVGVGAPPEGGGPSAQPVPVEVVKAGVAALAKQGAKVFVALASVGRGEAKRIADNVPELLAIVVGSSSSAGEANSESPPVERIGNVIIAQTANHLQSMAALDLFVRDGSYSFADATGLDAAQKRAELTRRVDELHVKIANWERDKNIDAKDLDARRADLAKLEAERAALDESPAPATGSFFRYTVREIRDSLGRDPSVEKAILGYYKVVNDHNRTAFAGRLPAPAAPNQPSYVGAEVCAKCHKDAKAFWDTTKHSHAYATLASQNKEFNLDCVSCHVTGYDQPGGSSVTHVEALMNVQCEVCHGPGSAHSAKPKVEIVHKKPKEDSCLACHHPPHVEQFDAKAKMAEILGPGHGL
jgi:2',3'-cyclic-nucleotide 2'-phosphodiesterase (5'-nucleotidase family)